MINIDHLNKYKCSHLIPTKNIDHTHRGIKNILNMSLILIQNKTITKKTKYLNPYEIISHMQQLTNTQTEIQVQTYMEIKKIFMT